MSSCVFSPPARQDLIDIHDYIARDDVEAALRFVQRLEQRCNGMADMPGMGRRREDLAPGLRSVTEGNYVIVYRPLEDGVRILRVLQGSRNLPSQFD